MSFKIEWKVWSQIQMKKGLACLAYTQKLHYIIQSTLEKKKKNNKNFFFHNYILLLAHT